MDPFVKIGGWSDEEQGRIFELMKEHFTSWSSISKSLNGRTENSIKNYFYSTIRRIQSCKVIEYIDAMKQQTELPKLESKDAFYTIYQLDSLNKLGVILCEWLYSYDKDKEEHKTLFDYLLNVIADEKKRPKKKPLESETIFDKAPSEAANQDHIQRVLPELFSGKNYQGVHPFLPIALYGGFGGMKSREFFRSVIQEPQASSFPPLFQGPQVPSTKLTYNLENTSDISVPIPQVKYTLRENPDSQIMSDLPIRLAEVLQNDKLQQTLFNLLLANLSRSVQLVPKQTPHGNWNSSSDPTKVAPDQKADSPQFRTTQQPRHAGFAPVNLHNFENTISGNLSQAKVKEETLQRKSTKAHLQGELTDPRKSSELVLKCSKCLLTSNICSCSQ